VVAEVSETSRSVRIPVAAAGAIEGQVLGAADTPGVWLIVLVPEDPPENPRLLSAFVNRQSRFSFSGLAPGKYRIAIQSSASPDVRLVPEDLSKMFEVDVAGGSATEIDLPAPSVQR
jgi:hypothetical protein